MVVGIICGCDKLEERFKDSLGGFGCGSDDGEMTRELVDENDFMSVIAW